MGQDVQKSETVNGTVQTQNENLLAIGGGAQGGDRILQCDHPLVVEACETISKSHLIGCPLVLCKVLSYIEVCKFLSYKSLPYHFQEPVCQ